MYVRPCPQGIKAQELFHQRASKSFCPRELCVTLWGRKFSPEAFTAGDCPILPCLLLLSGPDHTNSRAAGPAACLDQNPCPQRPHRCLLLTAPWVASVTNRRRLIDSPSLGRAQLFDHLGQTRGLQISSSTQNSGQNPKERDKKKGRKEGGEETSFSESKLRRGSNPPKPHVNTTESVIGPRNSEKKKYSISLKGKLFHLYSAWLEVSLSF